MTESLMIPTMVGDLTGKTKLATKALAFSPSRDGDVTVFADVLTEISAESDATYLDQTIKPISLEQEAHAEPTATSDDQDLDTEQPDPNFVGIALQENEPRQSHHPLGSRLLSDTEMRPTGNHIAGKTPEISLSELQSHATRFRLDPGANDDNIKYGDQGSLPERDKSTAPEGPLSRSNVVSRMPQPLPYLEGAAGQVDADVPQGQSPENPTKASLHLMESSLAAQLKSTTQQSIGALGTGTDTDRTGQVLFSNQAALNKKPSATPHVTQTHYPTILNTPLSRPINRGPEPPPSNAKYHAQPIAPTTQSSPALPIGSGATDSLNNLLDAPHLEEPRIGKFGEPNARLTQVQPSPQVIAPQMHHASAAEARAVASQMVTHFATNYGKTTVIRLDPEELGQVRMTLRSTELGMSMIIIAERPETSELMRRNIGELAAEFQSLGFENLDFQFGEQATDHQERQMHWQDGALTDSTDDAQMTINTHQPDDGRLDIRI